MSSHNGQEARDDFLKDLTALSLRHGIAIGLADSDAPGQQMMVLTPVMKGKWGAWLGGVFWSETP